MKYGIIVDSGCDLRVLDNSTESDIYYKRIPLTLRVGEKEYIDDENLDIEEFMKDMKGYHGKTRPIGSGNPSAATVSIGSNNFFPNSSAFLIMSRQ